MRIWGPSSGIANDPSAVQAIVPTAASNKPEGKSIENDSAEESDEEKVSDDERKLAQLVSNAEKVTLEIGRTIQELRVSKSVSRRQSEDAGKKSFVPQPVVAVTETVRRKKKEKVNTATTSSAEEG